MDSERWDVSHKPRRSFKKRLWSSVPRKRKHVKKNKQNMGHMRVEGCQTDANKLVQPDARRLDEDYVPENYSSFPEENGSPETNQPDSAEATQPQNMKQLHSDEQASFQNHGTVEIDFNHDEKAEIIPEIIDEWMIQKQLCRCCLAEGTFDGLNSTVMEEGITYQNILSSLSIELFPVASDKGDALRSVCDLCAARLRDAHAFCQQVHACDARFRTLYTRNCITVSNVEVEIKLEDDANVNGTEDDFDNESMPEEPLLIEKKLQPKETSKPKSKLKKSLPPKKKEVEEPAKSTNQSAQSTQKAKGRRRSRVTNEYYTTTKDKYKKCTQCDYTTRNGWQARRHFKIHLKDSLKCNLCDINEFTSLKLLKIHKLQEHNVDERYKCGACDKVFYREVRLKEHINIYHMLGELFKCSMCPFESYNKACLRKHMYKHKTTKDYHCKYCKKSFLRGNTLNFHERIHTGDKRKACVECGQAFVQKASLNYHMTKYHPGVDF